MEEEEDDALFELVDLVHAVARRLPAPPDLKPGPCTAIEIDVMRVVARNPGVSAREAARACRLPTSNFSRVLKGLVTKGLLERRTDPQDARIAHLHATDLTAENTARMRAAWARALDGAGLGPDAIGTVTQALRRIEEHISAAPAADAAATDHRPLPGGTETGRPTDAG